MRWEGGGEETGLRCGARGSGDPWERPELRTGEAAMRLLLGAGADASQGGPLPVTEFLVDPGALVLQDSSCCAPGTVVLGHPLLQGDVRLREVG